MMMMMMFWIWSDDDIQSIKPLPVIARHIGYSEDNDVGRSGSRDYLWNPISVLERRFYLLQQQIYKYFRLCRHVDFNGTKTCRSLSHYRSYVAILS